MSPNALWYLVGLITADGSLSKDGRHIDISSKRRDFLELIKTEFNISAGIGLKKNGGNGVSYRIQIGSTSFYRFLMTVGLAPNKTCNIKHVNVPSDVFKDFLRGVIDGDGCIRRWTYPNWH